MLRSAFRGKHPAESSAKDEKQEKSSHGRFHFVNREHEDRGDANVNENLNSLVTEGVSYSANDEELTIDYNHELLEAIQSSSSDKESTNEQENMSTKSLTPEHGANLIPDQEVIKTQSKGSFTSSERQIYEMQLAQLQEQLVTTMIDYQDMSAQLEKLKAVDVDKLLKELQEEKTKNNELKEKLKQKLKSSSSKLQRKNASRVDPRHGHGMASDCSERSHGDDWVDLGREDEIPAHSSPAVSHETNGYATASTVGQLHENGEGYDVLDSVPSGNEEEQTAARSGEEETPRVQRVKTKLEMWKVQAVDIIVDRLWDFVNDEPEANDEEDGEGEPLSVKALKENINRFTADIKPITSFIKSVHRVFTWRNPTASFLIFLVYMYSVWHGYLLSLILFTMIWKLFMNYLHATGIAKQLGFTEKSKEETGNTDDHSWSDKFQLVLQVARKVQNILGKMADSLEKIKNLLTWQHHEAARKLFTTLCFALLASLALRGPTLFLLIGLSLGIKLFIVNPIYHRFPKVKRRYDGTAKLWRELPTDEELSAIQAVVDASPEMPVRSSSMISLSPSTSEQSLSTSSNHVAEKFKLPSSETILPGWEDGKRCVLMDKDKPLSALSHVKHGRLFLTQSYLCFEKTRSSSGKHVVIKLDIITSISKAKPIGIMPGTGMALEVHVRGVEKPYIFGGIIGRDDVFESIKATGRAANIPWALM